jgi:MraZ protein
MFPHGVAACRGVRRPAGNADRRAKGVPGRMSQFFGRHTNRLDAKGRVSIPASFRAALRRANEGDGGGLVLRPSHQHDCIEGWPETTFTALAQRLRPLGLFNAAQDNFALAIYADAYTMEADKEGRIVLPEGLVAHAKLSETVVFLGAGQTFQIWEPAGAERRLAEAREAAKALSLAEGIA